MPDVDMGMPGDFNDQPFFIFLNLTYSVKFKPYVFYIVVVHPETSGRSNAGAVKSK